MIFVYRQCSRCFCSLSASTEYTLILPSCLALGQHLLCIVLDVSFEFLYCSFKFHFLIPLSRIVCNPSNFNAVACRTLSEGNYTPQPYPPLETPLFAFYGKHDFSCIYNSFKEYYHINFYLHINPHSKTFVHARITSLYAPRTC